MLKIQNLSVRFSADEKNYVLRDFNIDVYENDKIAIIGETGSGKSIMLLSILGLLPKNAISVGSIKYRGRQLLKLSRKEYNKIRGNMISYVPQGGGSSMNPLIKIGRQIGEPLYIHKKSDKKSAFKRAIDALKEFNIGKEVQRANNYPHTFSGGMRQRALIAMGIISDPELILADEPTKGLDPTRVKLVEDSFLKLQDKTYIVVTHDLNFAKNIAQKISVMLSKYQVEYGNKQDVMENPLHPYTQDIIMAMPENGLKYHNKFDLRLKQVDGECIYRQNCIYAHDKCNKMPPIATLENGRKVRCWKYSQ